MPDPTSTLATLHSRMAGSVGCRGFLGALLLGASTACTVPPEGGELGSEEATVDVAPTVTMAPAYDVEVTTHIYGEGLQHDDWGGDVVDTVDLELDVWAPVNEVTDRAAVLLIHGGGFTGGRRESREAFAQFYAERGFVVLNIDYRVAGHFGSVPAAWSEIIAAAGVSDGEYDQGMAMYPAARDAKAAARFLHANAAEFGIHPDYVTAIGGSAGSYLAIMLGVSEASDFRDELTAVDDPSLETTHLEARSDVHTIIDHWGGITHLEILEMLDGRSRFDESDAPVSIVHGTADPTVSFEHAENLRDAYLETGVPHAFHAIEGGRHAIWGVEVDGRSLEELSLEFAIDQQGLVVDAP